MPIAIDPRLAARLVERLATELDQATVFGNVLVMTSSMPGLGSIDRSLPSKGALAEELSLYIGDQPFSTFISGEIHRLFRGDTFDINVGEIPLSSFDETKDTRQVATELVRQFCSLPWSYEVCLRLPDGLYHLLVAHPGGITLSDRHRLVLGADLEDPYPKPTNLLSLSALASPTLLNAFSGTHKRSLWDKDAVYLVVKVDGYFRLSATEPILSARDDIFAFLGLGIALGLLSASAAHTLGEAPKSTQLIVYRQSPEDVAGSGFFALEDHQQKGIQSLDLVGDLGRQPSAIREKLDRISLILRSKEGKNIKLSARWLFDSYCGRDKLLSYVQATVALEILLGDEDADANVGLGTLIANRCAYLIATSPEGRANIVGAFRDIYRIRSKIVHRGKSRLNSDESSLFHYLQQLVKLVIDKEQRLMEREVSKE
ncbi:TPA: hypothetical protein ACXNQV_000165 [Stenotrophomonas maltophilia]